MEIDNPSSVKISQMDRGVLKRVLRTSDVFAIGYGDLGSSIYYTLGIVAFFALGTTPLVMFLAWLSFICTALSYAEMSSTCKDSGGSVSYSRRVFNDLISFIVGWGLLLDYIVTIAISAFTIAPYMQAFSPLLSRVDVHIYFTLGIIFILLIINILGVKQSTRSSFVLMVFAIFTQLIIIIIGLAMMGGIEKALSHITFRIGQGGNSPDWIDFIKGMAMSMVAYTGIESMAQLVGETKKSEKTVPRAIVWVIGVLFGLYFGLLLIGMSVFSPQELGNTYQLHPITGIVSHIPVWGKWLLPWTVIVIAFILFIASNAGLIGASRLSFNMGEYYQLPRFFYSIHKKFRTPYIALIFVACVASVIIILSQAQLSFLADLYNFGAQIAFFSTHVSLIMLRIKQPELNRPFKIRGNFRIKGKEIPITAILGGIMSCSIWVLVVVSKPAGRYLGITWMLLGLGMYLIYRRKKKISPIGQVSIQKIKVPPIVPITIHKILLPLKNSNQVEMMVWACEMAKIYRAKLLVVHVLEVPFSIPLDTLLFRRVRTASVILKTAEALALDKGIEVELKIVRARSIPEALSDIAIKETIDLILLEWRAEPDSLKKPGKLVEALLGNPPCRIWVSYSRNQPRVLTEMV